MDLRLVEVAQRTDTGRVREHNEDRLYARPPLLAVADGMGGAKAGEVAAQMTVDRLADTDPAPGPSLVLQAIADANREIRELSASDADHAGMGTTVTAVLVRGPVARVMHVGDSRAYVIRGDRIRQVTEDHSLVAEMVRQGTLTVDEAERHPSRNIITRVLGAEPDVAVDEVELALQPGDIVLICSDGLSTMIRSDDMVRIVTSSPSLRQAADALVRAALDAGGTDNVTVVLGRISGDATSDQAPEHTAELPSVPPMPADEPTAEVARPDPAPETDTDDAPTVETGMPPAGEPGPPPMRTAAVLEPAEPRRTRTIVGRIAWLTGAVLACIIAFGVWIGSRSYFMDARDGAETVRVYHGAPVSLLGVDLFRQWGDTHIAVDRTTSPATPALDTSVSGQGDAVWRAVALIWREGVPSIPAITVPPPAKTTPASTRQAQART